MSEELSKYQAEKITANLKIELQQIEIKEKQVSEIINKIEVLQRAMESFVIDEVNTPAGGEVTLMRTFKNEQLDIMANKLMELINKL